MKQLIILISFASFAACNKDNKNIMLTEFQIIHSFTDADLTDIYFADDNNGIVCGSFGCLFQTNDGGKNWYSLNVGTNESFMSAFMLGAGSIFTARLGIYGSSDSGKSFTELGGLSNTDNSIFGIHFFNNSTGLILKSPLILKTNDGGNTWNVKYSGAEYPHQLQFTSNNVGYIAGGITYDGYSKGEMHKTIDGGETWNNLNVISPEITALYFLNNDTGYYCNFYGEIFKTTNGGNIWEKVSQLSSIYITSIYFVDEGIGYLTTAQGKIFKSTDGGKHWNEIFSASNSLVKIIKTHKMMYVIGNSGLLLRKEF